MVKVVIDQTKGLVQSAGDGVVVEASSPLTVASTLTTQGGLQVQGQMGIASSYSAAATTTGTLAGQVTANHIIFASGSAGAGPNPKVHQQAPNVLGNDTAVLTAAAIAHGVAVITPTAARSKATATATALNNGLALNANLDAFDFNILNLATSGERMLTITAGTGVTLVGQMVVAPNAAVIVSGSRVTTGGSTFRYQRSGATTGILYRLS